MPDERIRNCWEYHRCGREPGGHNVAKLGVCPAATAEWCDGLNRGTNGGRYCWAIAGTFCHGEVQGHFALKFGDCTACGFFQEVYRQERVTTILTNAVAKRQELSLPSEDEMPHSHDPDSPAYQGDGE